MQKETKKKTKKVEFDFEKSNSYRSIFIDGAFGGITPSGNIQFAIYNERTPIPQSVKYEISEDGTLGQEVERTSRKSNIYREVEANLIMSPETAYSIAIWLLEKVEQSNLKMEDVSKDLLSDKEKSN